MTEPTLRVYESGDWRAMHALDVQCFAPPFRFTRRDMRGFAEVPGAIALLAEADTQLVGFGIVQIESQKTEGCIGYVVTLDVAQPWRRQGLGGRLMHQLETRAQAAGAGSMALHVFGGNIGAVKLYQALGYEQIGIAADFYARGFDALIYRKSLETPHAAVTRMR